MDPKKFYRELDMVLDRIKKEKVDDTFFQSVLTQMDQAFGRDLGVVNSHIYEKRNNRFILVLDCRPGNGYTLKKVIQDDSEAVQAAMKQGVVLLDNKDWISKSKPISDKKYTLTAIHVHKSVRHWLFIFQIDSRKMGEEVQLFLNSMRTGLNYRLFSEMMRNDLKRAEEIQRSLLPSSPPRVKGYDIFARSIPAEVVGGDFYEYFGFSDRELGVAIGDASGHGIPAALLVRDVVIGLRMGLATEMRLVHIINKLNKVIQMSTYSTSFVSLFVGEIEEDGHLFYVNAGHPAPFLVNGETIHDLPATGITLGFMPELSMHRSYIHMEPGSVLVLYSDGIVERKESDQQLFDIDRLKELVIFNQYKSAKEIVESIIDAVDKFGEEKSLEDDATMVVIKRIKI